MSRRFPSCLVAAVLLATPAGAIDLFGIHLGTGGLYSISTQDASVTWIGDTNVPGLGSLLRAPDGFLYAVSFLKPQKLPPECFAIYVAMQGERSYQAIADRFGATKRAVQKLADREHWTERLAAIERDVQEKMDRKLGESLGEIRERHLKMARAIGNRAVRGLSEFPLTSAMEAVKAAEVAIKLERMIAGEPTERTALNDRVDENGKTLVHLFPNGFACAHIIHIGPDIENPPQLPV